MRYQKVVTIKLYGQSLLLFSLLVSIRLRVGDLHIFVQIDKSGNDIPEMWYNSVSLGNSYISLQFTRRLVRVL
jgi:hypothetical protein